MAANPEWHYAKNNQQLGPVSSAELKQLAANGELSPNDLIWKDGMAEWKVAGTVKGLFHEKPAMSAPPPIPKRRATALDSNHKKAPDILISDAVAKAMPFWQRVPLAALLTVCCFPIGLFLVWSNPRLSRQSKAIWIGGFSAIFVCMMIFAQQSAQRAREELSAANQLWASGDNQAAISKYRGLTTRLSLILESDRSLVLGRVIDFDADTGNDASVNELFKIANDEHVVPTFSSEKARSLQAKRLDKQNKLTSASNKKPDSSQSVTPTADSPKPDIPSIAKGRISATELIAHLKRVEKLELHTPEKGSPTKGSPFEYLGKTIDEPCRVHVGGRVDFGQNVSVILMQSEKDGRISIIILGTPFDPKMPITRGNELTSIDSFLQTLLPEMKIRKLVGEQSFQLLGEGAKADYGKAHVVVSYDGKKELRVTIYVDDDAPQ